MSLASAASASWRRNALLLVGASVLLSHVAAAQVPSLVHAHAHNDYEHDRPLIGALELGFNSVEADVYLVNGALLVGHSRDSLSDARTLESLYLAPLSAWIRQHGGRAIGGAPPLTLLIDVKSDSNATWPVLERELRRYADMFVSFGDGARKDRRVVAIVSGNRAIGAMRTATTRMAAVDGRLADLTRVPALPPELVPLVSDSWERISKWKGESPAPDSLLRAIREITATAHRNGQRVRFWATADSDRMWQFLLDAGVDLIGTDELSALRTFLLRRQ